MSQENNISIARLAPALFISLVSFASCVITDVGNPPQDEEFEATIQVELRQGEDAPVQAQTMWLSAERFRLIDAETCSNDAPADRAEGFVFEVEPDVLGEAVTFTKTRGEFCRLGLLLDPTPDVELPAGSPAELSSASLVLEATRVSDDTPIVVVLDVSDKLALDASNERFGVSEDAARFVISLDTTAWWDAEAIAMAEAGEDGIIRIDAENNSSVRDALVGQLGDKITLHLDRDGDNALDDTERAEVLASGGLVAP